MAIPDADPAAADLDAAFDQAMTGPAKPRAEAKPPGQVDHDAPFGREDDGTPKAPYGLTRDGRIRRSAGGRPRKDDPGRARVVTIAPAAPDDDKPPAGQLAARDWTEELDGLATAGWFGLSAVSKVSGRVPVLGRLLPERKLAAQAFVLDETKPRLIAAVNLAAQHNASAAEFCRKLEGGNGIWALTCMFMVLPVLDLSVTIWRGDEKALAENKLPSLAEMAKRNEAKMDEAVKKIERQIAQAAASAQGNGQAATEETASPAAE